MGALEQHENPEKLVIRLSPMSARFASVLSNDQPSGPFIEQLNKAIEQEISAIRAADIRARELATGERGHFHPTATLDAADFHATQSRNRTLSLESMRTHSRDALLRGGRANGKSPRRTVRGVLLRKSFSRLNSSRLPGRDAKPTVQPQRQAMRTPIEFHESSSLPPDPAGESNIERPATEPGFEGERRDVHLGGWEPEASTESVSATLHSGSISHIVVPPTPTENTGNSKSRETGQSGVWRQLLFPVNDKHNSR